MSSEQLKLLITKRLTLSSAVTRAANFIKHYTRRLLNASSRKEVEERLDSLLPVLDSFNAIMDEVESLDEENMSDHNLERESFEDYYYDTKAKFEKLLEGSPTEVTSSNAPSEGATSASQTNSQNSLPNVKLPTIDLPSFDGSYREWKAFSELFDSLIHSNDSIDDTQKFYYLRSCLKGEASQTIKSLAITSANYAVAWSLLKERFENKRLIITQHIEPITNFPQLSKDAPQLRRLVDNIQSNLRALQSLDEPVSQWGSLLVIIVSQKLDFATKCDWESQTSSNSMPTFDMLIDFLKRRCDIYASLSSKIPPKVHVDNTHTRRAHYNSHTAISSKLTCYHCNGNHSLYSCEKFMTLSSGARNDRVTEMRLCHNCLSKSHPSKSCKSPHVCRKCSKRHHTLLHPSEHSADELASSSTTSVLSSHASISRHMLLSTAKVMAIDTRGKTHNCRIILDSGSQANFVTRHMCEVLGIKLDEANVNILGVNSKSVAINHKAFVKIKSNHTGYNNTISCFVLNKITERLPLVTIDFRMLDIPNNIQLADPTFHKTGDIDMLVGIEVFWDLMSIGQIKLGKNLPVLQKTVLEWIVGGSMPNSFGDHKIISASSIVTLEQQLEKFWKIEQERNTQSILSQEQAICENTFKETTTRTDEGRFVVNIRIKGGHKALGDSRTTAIKRFFTLDSKLSRNPELKSQYIEFMNEYERYGHMSPIVESKQSQTNFYFPHHPVLNQNSATTKLRVVFDGSARSSSGASLNDIQCVGPTIQLDIFSILNRFRRHTYALTGDIAKMYRQVRINPSQRSLQRIFWRTSPELDLKCFELNTVTYGTASAPFLAIRCLKELAIIHKHSHPIASSVIESDFYVDDLLTGANTLDEVSQLKSDVTSILSSAGFNLRKWSSNDDSIFSNTDKSVTADMVNIINTDEIKTLGVVWNRKRDSLNYVNRAISQTRITKRTILSTIAQIYDPLGLLAPIVIVAKVIMQQLWQLKLNWDESLPAHLHLKWCEFVNSLYHLKSLTFNRHILCLEPQEIELHGFCDASEVAYGACIYIRATDQSGAVTIRLLCAKSKVAPLQKTTIPRLEICGALLLANLTERVKRVMQINYHRCYLWCDSTIVLSWIKSPSNRWKTFVANKVADIQDKTMIEDWHHIRTNYNPADLISRGTNTLQLSSSHLWNNGPEWLSAHSATWPSEVVTSVNDIPEERNIIVAHAMITSLSSIFVKFI